MATTIAPANDLTNQLTAISSWLELGFKVVSLNSLEEIELLHVNFPGVEFIPVSRDARKQFGKPYIYLDDIFTYLAHSGSAICGIINSDIHFVSPNLGAFVEQEAVGSMVFGARVDVTSLDKKEEGEWFRGYDYFFFDRQLLNDYPQEDFCLGLPWWDYWMLLVPLARRRRVKRILSPVAYHLFHPTRYGCDSWIPLGFSLNKYFSPSCGLTEETMGWYNQLMFQVIDQNSAVQPIFLTNFSEIISDQEKG
ncbi:MAG TPA: hypothetical protein VHP38_16175 [Ruminiclostridium sp.]|nr:hypothetical protein [Ruminiclostridium sp.]